MQEEDQNYGTMEAQGSGAEAAAATLTSANGAGSNEPALTWCMPSSVLNALWGNVMPRLAAAIWAGELEWPPEGPGQTVNQFMRAYPVEGALQADFWEVLATISFGSRKNYLAERDRIEESLHENPPKTSAMHRAAHVVLKYFEPPREGSPAPPFRGRFRVIRAEGYDFVLSSEGIDVFVPPDPFVGDDGERSGERARAEIIRMYKFRETGRAPIAIPGQPSTVHPKEHGYHIPIPQLNNPTGSFQIHEDWARGESNDVGWWLTGSAYRGMMHELPRVIASLWYEALAWNGDAGSPAAGQRTVSSDFNAADGYVPIAGDAQRPTGLRRLLEERTETRFPRDMAMKVLDDMTQVPGLSEGQSPPDTWSDCDVMITNLGFFFPHPPEPPELEELLGAIKAGTAGNPVFTDSGPI